jgi:myo-inositol-1-phosphate synthase
MATCRSTWSSSSKCGIRPSAGVVIDAVRCAKLGLDRGLSGALEGPAAYFMKSPPIQHRDEEARQMVEAFIADSAAAEPAAVQREPALVAD